MSGCCYVVVEQSKADSACVYACAAVSATLPLCPLSLQAAPPRGVKREASPRAPPQASPRSKVVVRTGGDAEEAAAVGAPPRYPSRRGAGGGRVDEGQSGAEWMRG